MNESDDHDNTKAIDLVIKGKGRKVKCYEYQSNIKKENAKKV